MGGLKKGQIISSSFKKGISGNPKTKFKKGHKPWNKGKKCSNISKGLTGKKLSNKTKKKLSAFQQGISVDKWKEFKKGLNYRLRKSKEYKLWREAVFKRDNYTCIWCGQVGGKLNADHIKPFALFPELRFAIDNGRTLCEDCHRKTDTYGGNSKKCSN